MADLTTMDYLQQACTSNVNPENFEVNFTEQLQLSHLDPADLGSLTYTLQSYIEAEQQLLQQALQISSEAEQELTVGFSELLLRKIPDPPENAVVPSIMERTKRPLNHQRFQKEILQEWLFAHVDNPYPTDLEKADLAARTGLPIRQVTTWLQNARTRILPKIRENRAAPGATSSEGGPRTKKAKRN